MEHRTAASRPAGTRLAVFGVLGLALALALGVTARLAHTSTIPNLGLPTSNSKNLPNLSAYEPQVSLTREYLGDLVTMNYAAAYQLLAPSVRGSLSQQQFEADRRTDGVLGQPVIWADDQTSTRAEYVLARSDGSNDTRRHRFLLKREDGRWWIDHETPVDSNLPVASSLSAAMSQYVQQRAGKIWAPSAELLRQETFQGGQLLLFSYIEPKPATVLNAERVAVLNYYVNTAGGWQFQGGGATGLAAGMNLADVAMGFTAFGPDQQYTAYYGVIENANTVALTFEEPNGAPHSENVKSRKTVLYLNERNPYEPLPFSRPFKSLGAKDLYGNNLRTNPTVLPPAVS
jgi:hypothetical protein